MRTLIEDSKDHPFQTSEDVTESYLFCQPWKAPGRGTRIKCFLIYLQGSQGGEALVKGGNQVSRWEGTHFLPGAKVETLNDY